MNKIQRDVWSGMQQYFNLSCSIPLHSLMLFFIFFTHERLQMTRIDGETKLIVLRIF